MKSNVKIANKLRSSMLAFAFFASQTSAAAVQIDAIVDSSSPVKSVTGAIMYRAESGKIMPVCIKAVDQSNAATGMTMSEATGDNSEVEKMVDLPKCNASQSIAMANMAQNAYLQDQLRTAGLPVLAIGKALLCVTAGATVVGGSLATVGLGNAVSEMKSEKDKIESLEVASYALTAAGAAGFVAMKFCSPLEMGAGVVIAAGVTSFLGYATFRSFR